MLAVLTLALLETGAHFYFKDRAPAQSEWQALKPRVAALAQPGDLVVVAPNWGEPMARLALGDELMPLSMVARAGDDGFSRVIELGVLGQSRSEFSTWPSLRHEHFGKFEIFVRKNPRWEQVRFEALEHVDAQSLSVALIRNGIEEGCPFTNSATMTSGNLGGDPTAPKERFNCSGGGIHWVGITIIDDEQYRPRRCLWAPPSHVGDVLLRFRQVAFGKRLVGHAGAPWLMVRDGVGPAVKLLATTVKGAIGAVAAKDTDGWVRFEWNTEALQNTVLDLDLRLPAITGEQRFCFALEAR